MSEAIAELERRLAAPALLADVADAIDAGTTLVGKMAPGSPERERARARLESLWARVDPQAVLDRLVMEPLPAEHDLVRIEALLELEQPDEAEQLLERHDAAGPRWALARARLLDQRGRRDEAIGAVDAVLAGACDPETRATALSFRFRWRALAGRLEEASSDVAELRALLDQHGAVLSELIVRGLAVYALHPLRTIAVRWRAAEVVDATIADLVSGVDETQERLGPLPLHVHALFVKLRDLPERLVSLAVRLAGTQLVAGRRGDAWLTLYYVDQLAARLLPARWAEETAQALAAMRERLGPDEVEIYEEDRQRRSAAHLARRPRESA